MTPFTVCDGLIAPLDRANVDTDAIIPKQFLKSIHRHGFGANLFDEWRYLDYGEPGQDCRLRPRNLDFVLNQARYAGATTLLARENFGCGSSREHAAWALADYGFKALLAPSFADIFYNNCLKNGLLPIVLPGALIDRLFDDARRQVGYVIHIDLQGQSIRLPGGEVETFAIEESAKHRLLHGLDDVQLTLQHSKLIEAHEHTRAQLEPWLF